jgi:hypothetical protein
MNLFHTFAAHCIIKLTHAKNKLKFYFAAIKYNGRSSLHTIISKSGHRRENFSDLMRHKSFGVQLALLVRPPEKRNIQQFHFNSVLDN